MDSFLIRQAVLADLDDIAPLFDAYRQFYGRASDLKAAKQFLHARFNHAESIIFLAYDGLAPVGFTQLYPSFSSVSMARVFILNDLFVVPSHRRQGVGALLLSAATDYARSFNAVRLSLSTDIQNTTAQAAYEALGWKRDKGYYAYHFEI